MGSPENYLSSQKRKSTRIYSALGVILAGEDTWETSALKSLNATQIMPFRRFIVAILQIVVRFEFPVDDEIILIVPLFNGLRHFGGAFKFFELLGGLIASFSIKFSM